MNGGKYLGWPAERERSFKKMKMHQQFDKESRAKLKHIYSNSYTNSIDVPTYTTVAKREAPNR